jgi:hypothetical protein
LPWHTKAVEKASPSPVAEDDLIPQPENAIATFPNFAEPR